MRMIPGGPVPPGRNDDGGDGDLVRQFAGDISRLSDQVARLADRMDDVAINRERVDRLGEEVQALRRKIDDPAGLTSRLAKLENGGITPSSLAGWVAAAVALLGVVVAAAMQLIGWIMGLWKHLAR